MKKRFLIVVFLFCVVGISSCGDDEPNNNNNLLVGEWYWLEYWGYEQVNFTETTICATNVYDENYDYPDVIFYNTTYNIINDDTLILNNLPIDRHSPEGYIKTKFIMIAYDTLIIEHFIPSDAAVLYPENLNSIKLIRKINYFEYI